MSLNDLIFYPSMEDLLSRRTWYIMNDNITRTKKNKMENLVIWHNKQGKIIDKKMNGRKQEAEETGETQLYLQLTIKKTKDKVMDKKMKHTKKTNKENR